MHAGAVPEETKKFRKGADFLFGVLIAVSLEKAVEGFLRIATQSWTAQSAIPQESVPTGHPACWLTLLRLAVFTSLIANFYFGSIRFFDKTYCDLGSPIPDGFGSRFRVDVFSGLIHFALFYTWSLSVGVAGTVSFRFWGLSGTPFLLMLVGVLAYDLFWLAARLLATFHSRPAPWNARDPNTHREIWGWTWKNLALAAGIIVLAHFTLTHPILTEGIAGGSAMALNLWEFAGIVS